MLAGQPDRSTRVRSPTNRIIGPGAGRSRSAGGGHRHVGETRALLVSSISPARRGRADAHAIVTDAFLEAVGGVDLDRQAERSLGDPSAGTLPPSPPRSPARLESGSRVGIVLERDDARERVTGSTRPSALDQAWGGREPGHPRSGPLFAFVRDHPATAKNVRTAVRTTETSLSRRDRLQAVPGRALYWTFVMRVRRTCAAMISKDPQELS